MTERSVTHATFVLERNYDAPPSRVFAAWADPEAKARWFGGGEAEYQMDFSVGGREHNSGTMGSDTYAFDAVFQDIVEDERIVYSYDMHLNGQRISVSVATVEFKPQGEGGTQLVFTEQGVFLDGFDDPRMREQGTGGLLEALDKELKGSPAA